jgi:hypothetical protein
MEGDCKGTRIRSPNANAGKIASVREVIISIFDTVTTFFIIWEKRSIPTYEEVYGFSTVNRQTEHSVSRTAHQTR